MLRRKNYAVLSVFMLLLFFPVHLLAKQGPIQIKYAHIGPPSVFGEPMHASATAFKYMMEKETNGKYKVDIYPAGTLGKEIDLMEAVRNNVIQVHGASMGGLHRIYPPAILAFAPYVFKNERIAVEVINGPFGRKLLDEFTAKTGVKGLIFNDIYTFLGISNSVRQIKTPEDLKGIKFRAMDTLQLKMFQALGASAVPVAFSEIYSSLQTGVVNGQTNPALLINAMKWYEVQKYMSLTRSQFGYQWIVCNNAWYEKLPQADKNAVLAATEAAVTAGRGVGILQEAQNIVDLGKKGMEVYSPSEAEIDQFRALAKPACLEWLKTQMSPELVDEFLAAIADTEKKLGY
jgi:tripartite ATP-independent transporter DctP family solute receptor